MQLFTPQCWRETQDAETEPEVDLICNCCALAAAPTATARLAFLLHRPCSLLLLSAVFLS
jgi:hypothetical protein